MADIFISYSRRDIAFVRRLGDELSGRGRDIWVDWEDIPPAADWFDKIKAGIEATRALIFILSPDSVTSQVCLAEVNHALAHHKRLIPLVIRDVEASGMHDSLGRLNWIFFREHDDVGQAVDRLLSAVDTDLEWVDAHTALLAKALEWERKARDASLLLLGQELKDAEVWQVKSAEKDPKPTELMAEFILSSRQSETRRQRLRLMAAGSALGISLLVGSVAVWQWWRAEKNRQEALARQLAAQSEFLLSRRAELPRAALLAAEAAKRKPVDADVYSAYHDVLVLLPKRRRVVNLGGPVVGARFGPQGGSLLISREKTAETWDLEAGARMASVEASDAIDATALSRDGGRFAVADRCHVVVYDTRNGASIAEAQLNQRVEPFMAPGCLSFGSIDFSPDGRLIAAGGDSLVTRVWNLETGGVADLSHHRSAPASDVNSVTFSPDGTRLASMRTGDVAVWTISDWQQADLPEPPPWGYGEALTFSLSRGIYLGAVTGYGLVIWDAQDGRRANAMPLPGNNFTRDVAIAFNNQVQGDRNTVPEGEMIAASAGNDAVVWTLDDGRLSSGREMARLRHQGPIRSLGFSPDSKYVLSASDDGTASVWEVSGGEELARLVHTAALRAAVFGEAGMVWTVDAAGIAQQWDISAQERIPAASGEPIRFSADGHFLTIQQEFRTEVIEVRPAAGAKPRRFSGSYYATWDGVPGAYLAIRYSEAGVEVRNLLNGNRILYLDNRDLDESVDSGSYTHGIDGAFFSRDARYLAVYGPSFADAWQIATGRRLNLGDGGHKLADIFFSADGRRVAGRLDDGRICVVELASGKRVALIDNTDREHKIALVFSPDGRYLAKMNPPVRVWDTRASDQTLAAYASDDYDLHGESFTADSAYVVARQHFGNVVVHELATAHAVVLSNEEFAHVEPSPTLPLVAIGTGNTVRLFEPHSERDVARIDHEGVSVLAFSTDGKLLATGGYDGLLRVWETISWREVARVRHKGTVGTIRFSPDGQFAAVGVMEKPGSLAVTSYISPVRPADPEAELCGRITRNLTDDEWNNYLPSEPHEETCPENK